MLYVNTTITQPHKDMDTPAPGVCLYILHHLRYYLPVEAGADSIHKQPSSCI